MKTIGTPLTRVTRNEAAATWASNGEVWAMLHGDLRQILRLNPRDDDEVDRIGGIK